MEKFLDNIKKSIEHLNSISEVFKEKTNFSDIKDWTLYDFSLQRLSKIIDENPEFLEQLYAKKGRQMILADLLEYILLGRGYYFVTSKEKKGIFIEVILNFVNLLMSYESITVDDKLRKNVLEELKKKIPEIEEESIFNNLLDFKGKVGLTEEKSDADKEMNKYFDTLLPKTAGGLWHELLVYVFMLRHNVGFILPLLLNQRLLSFSGSIVPPDFLLITEDKNIYGVEVGKKKEIQSGSFSLQTNIPTATIDTINSRASDRCPICNRWILLCPKVIKDFADLDKKIPTNPEFKCLDCDFFKPEDIANGACPYTKYSRNKASSLEHTNHEYTDGLHYHYQCVLDNVDKKIKELIIKAKDYTALKTHYLYYSGLEALLKNG